MANCNMVPEIKYIPEKWQPTDDWDSHRPLLYLALLHTEGPVIEFGCGYGSTLQLQRYCEGRSRQFISIESSKPWADKFDIVTKIDNYLNYDWSFTVRDMPSVLFIDCAPGEMRKDLLLKYGPMAEVTVVHDTEPGAEYVYGMYRALSEFKYRCDLHIEGMPQTTAVSNTYDFKEWRGVYNEKFNVI